ncbi:MAG: glycosyltransferase family 2 protein [Ktedonobacteraceae bacterium]
MDNSPPSWAACIIVTYNPDSAAFSSLVTRLLGSPVAIYVVDNWFSDEVTQTLREICQTHQEKITFIPLDENYGIAKAINCGIESARADQHKYAMLFDQDSLPQQGLMEELQTVTAKLAASNERVAAIGPRLYDPRSATYFRFGLLKWGMWQRVGCNCGNGDLIRCEFINSSGSLLFLRHWEQIGSFCEEFFIDHVETEWYMRVRKLGLECYGFCSCGHIEHHMGDDVCRYWFGKWRFMPRRPPQRHYTIVRNGIWMWRLNHTPIAWITNSVMKIMFTLVYFSLFDREGKKQFYAILKGIRDGLFHRSYKKENI